MQADKKRKTTTVTVNTKSTPIEILLSQGVLANKLFEPCVQVLGVYSGFSAERGIQEKLCTLSQNDGIKTDGD